MRPSRGLRGAAAAAIALCGVAGGDSAFAKDPPLLSLTAEHFKDTATVKDAPPGAAVSISTQDGFVEHSGPLHMVWHDEFLSALIDRKSGEKSFQVHEEVTYNGNWRYYQSASLPGGGRAAVGGGGADQQGSGQLRGRGLHLHRAHRIPRR